jgi:hypothetical protein
LERDFIMSIDDSIEKWKFEKNNLLKNIEKDYGKNVKYCFEEYWNELFHSNYFTNPATKNDDYLAYEFATCRLFGFYMSFLTKINK